MREQTPSQPSSKEVRDQQGASEIEHKAVAEEAEEEGDVDVHLPHAVKKTKPPRPSLRAGLAVVGGRAAGAVSRRLHLGGGTSVVGLVAQRLYPDIVEHLATQLEYGSVIVTGTNGKTTTSSFIWAILGDAGLRAWRNREGSNLMRGVASSLVIRALPNGQLRRGGKAISILEIDEAVLPQVVQLVDPRVVVFTNLFRDQLDRYGEVDSVLAYWQQAIRALTPQTTLVLNADDPAIASLGETFAGKVLYYGIQDLSLALEDATRGTERHQVMDTRTCPRCGHDFEYSARFYSHIGLYHCPHCGLQRPQLDVRALEVHTDDFDRSRTTFAFPTFQQQVTIPLSGLYNIYNALAAATAAYALDIGRGPIVSGIEQFKPVFGRGERIQVEGRTIRLLLAKNPTGFNEVLRTLFSEETTRHVLFVLNDHIADGQDISWIWDVDFERMIGHLGTLVVAGTRALDLAIRLKYAGVDQEQMKIVPPAPVRAMWREQENRRRGRSIRKGQQKGLESPAAASYIQIAHSFGLRQALDMALQSVPIGETLFIVPTYTGLLEIHRELERRGLTPRYWEGAEA